MLEADRRKVLLEVQGGIRAVRADGKDNMLRGTGEASDTATLEVQEGMRFALIEGKAEVLNRLDEDLSMLDEGKYGFCGKCGDQIPEARLKALPFASRCLDCERKREDALLQGQASHKPPPSAWFPRK